MGVISWKWEVVSGKWGVGMKESFRKTKNIEKNILTQKKYSDRTPTSAKELWTKSFWAIAPFLFYRKGKI